MEEEILKEPQFTDEIVSIIRSGLPDEEIIEKLHDYHDNDIARSLETLTKEERIHLYNILDPEWVSEILLLLKNRKIILRKSGLINWRQLSMKWIPMMRLIFLRKLMRA